MNLTLIGPDWKFGDVLRLREHDRKHEYLYMFVHRRPRFAMKDGTPNDRGFAALCLGVPDCPYPAGDKLFPCNNDHGRFGTVWSSYSGLPTEDAWELIESVT